MTFRDDSDAILARNTALEAENAKLNEERDEARAALERARAQVEALEQEKRALEARLPKPKRRRPDHDLRLWFALAGFVIIAGASAFWTCARDAPDRAEHPDKPPGPARRVDTLESITALRLCLDNGDLYLRLFLVAPADARRSDMLGHVKVCAGVLDRAHGEDTTRASKLYRESLAVLQPHVEALFRFFESGAVVHDTDGTQRAGLEWAARTNAQAWLQASDLLRAAAVEPYDRAKADGFDLAKSSVAQVAYLRFSAAAASFLDGLVVAGVTQAQCAAAAEGMNEEHRSAGSSAYPRWLELIELARAICDVGPGITAANAPRVLDLVSRYNEQGLGRPYPF